MDYGKAKDIRQQGLFSLMTDRLSSGQGTGSSIKSAISDRTQATFTGIKEKFDPMNIAKVVTGGSKFAPALVGALMGRSKDDISHFTGKKRNKKLKSLASQGSDASESMAEVLGLIYRQMMRIEESRKLELEERITKDKEDDEEDNRRNTALITALTGRKQKKPSKKATEQKKELDKKIEKEKKKVPEIKGKGKGKGQAEKPPTPKEEPTIQPPKPAPTEPVPKPTTPTKAPTGPSAAVPKPSAPSTAAKVPSKAAEIIGGAAVVGTAALIGTKAALAANISQFESGKAGYNAYNKGTVGNKMIPSDKPIDFSKMTIAEFLRRGSLKQGDPDRLFAVGKYQIIPSTMKELVKQLKLDPESTYLDPATQDNLFTNGLVGVRRKKVDAYIKGTSDDRDGAILQLAQEFASVGVPYDMNVNGKSLKKGDSYYSGIGGNKAHNSPEQVGAALDSDRLKNLQSAKAGVPDVNTGARIDTASTDNKTLKKDAAAAAVIKGSVNNTNINTQTMASNTPQKEDDTNPYVKKAQSR
jgi:hypothetical protein